LSASAWQGSGTPALPRIAPLLAEILAAAHPAPSTPDNLAAVAVAYVQFALRRPALFRVMFGEPCDRDSAERIAATEAIFLTVRTPARMIMWIVCGDPGS
jgi:hypothetical protein